MNQGFVDGENYHKFQQLMRVRQNLREYAELVNSLEEDDQNEVRAAVGQKWFSQIMQISHPELVAGAKPRRKEDVLAELADPDCVSVVATTDWGPYEVFDPGDGCLTYAKDLYVAQIEGLVPVSNQFVFIAKSRLIVEMAEAVSNRKSPPPSEDIGRRLKTACSKTLSRLERLESFVSQHQLRCSDFLRHDITQSVHRGRSEPPSMTPKELQDLRAAFYLEELQKINDWIDSESRQMGIDLGSDAESVRAG